MLSIFRVDDVDDVVLAQVNALKRRVPIVYLILILNTVTLSYSHYGAGSALVTLVAPGAVVVLMAVRLLYWRRLQALEFTPHQARQVIRVATVLAGIVGLLLLSWSMAMLHYNVAGAEGTMSGDGHVVFYAGITTICCMVLIMHLTGAAVLVALTVVPAFCWHLAASGEVIEPVVAVNFLLVAIVMLHVLREYSHEFREAVVARRELRDMSETNTILANTDTVTGLPNRRHLFTKLQRTQEAKDPYGVIVLDLDGFKQVNDLHGHPAGDKVLIEVGKRLSALVPSRSCFARMGGDEFAVFLPGMQSPEGMLELSHRLIDSLLTPIAISGAVVTVGACAGISIADPGTVGYFTKDHYKQADYALFHVKKNGRGSAAIYSPEHEESIKLEGTIEQCLRRADLEQEVSLACQPVVDANTHQIVAYEMLARWHSPQLGSVSPAQFIPVAERAQLIQSITRVVLKKALGAALDWPHHLGVKVNLSMRDLSSPEQVMQLLAIVRQSGIDPKRVEFEITESALSLDLDCVHSAIDLFRALGVTMAIDDFGSGYSNLRYIHRLQPQTIKIDRGFVSCLGTDESATSIVKTIIELCNNVGARSLGEGVETREQADILRDLGCNEIQGYYFGKPVPIEQIGSGQPALLVAARN